MKIPPAATSSCGGATTVEAHTVYIIIFTGFRVVSPLCYEVLVGTTVRFAGRPKAGANTCCDRITGKSIWEKARYPGG
jgi:hypothetical protein